MEVKIANNEIIKTDVFIKVAFDILESAMINSSISIPWDAILKNNSGCELKVNDITPNVHAMYTIAGIILPYKHAFL